MLCDKALQHLTSMIHGPPRIMRLAVDLHEYLIQMPLPVCPRPHSIGNLPKISGQKSNFLGRISDNIFDEDSTI